MKTVINDDDADEADNSYKNDRKKDKIGVEPHVLASTYLLQINLGLDHNTPHTRKVL